MKNKIFSLKTSMETIELGKAIGAKFKKNLNDGYLKTPFLITLNGELGAGKTTFCQGFTNIFSLDENNGAFSPSFSLANEYETNPPIFHLDLYRLEDPPLEEFLASGLDEYLVENACCLIEWSEKLPEDYWPSKRLDLNFKLNDSNLCREVKISSPEEKIFELFNQ